MIEIYYRNLKDKKLRQIETFRVGSWVNVYDPSAEEIEKVAKMLKVEKSILTDALDPFEVPRLEMEDGVTYVFTRVPEAKGKEIETIPLMIALGKNFTLTLSAEKLAFLENFTKGRQEIYTTQKIKLFLYIFSSINGIYNSLIISISRRLRSVRVRIEKSTVKDIVQFVDFERIMNDFLSALVPTNTVLHKILSGKHIRLYEEDADLVEDLLLDNQQLIETSKSTLKNVINLRSAYSNIMNHDLNRVIRILTSLTILLTIPTMIFSFYGMNVDLPFDDTPIAFVYIIFSTILISTSLLIFFVRKRWL